MSGETVWSDLRVEAGLLGQMLVSEGSAEDIGRQVDGSDFHSPANRSIFEAIVGLWSSGQALDPTTVAGRLADAGQLDMVGGPAAIVSLIPRACGRAGVTSYVTRLLDKTNARHLSESITYAASRLEGGASPGAVYDDLIDAGGRMTHADLDGPVDDLVSIERWEEQGRTESMSPWAIRGLLRSDWRLMVTAGGGVGKATLCRQIVYAASVGVHPFNPDRSIPPCRGLIVDLENPAAAAQPTVRMMIDAADASSLFDAEQAAERESVTVWPRVDGINILDRRDRVELEKRIRKVRPGVVFIGPLYKLFRAPPRASFEDVALDVCSILDDLRTRYGFALILEHHSAKGADDLAPFGSSVWERWPEFGKTLRPIEKGDPTRLAVGKFRFDRVRVKWPMVIEHGKTWPWVARYEPVKKSDTPDPGDF